MGKVVELVPVRDEDMPEFKRRLQESFTRAAEEAFPEWTAACSNSRRPSDRCHAG